jgi:hypothetical protein
MQIVVEVDVLGCRHVVEVGGEERHDTSEKFFFHNLMN